VYQKLPQNQPSERVGCARWWRKVAKTHRVPARFQVYVLAMFHRSFPWSFAVALLLCGGVARAELKLGYVDLQRALQEVHEGREAKARLKAEFDRTKSELEKEERKLTEELAVLEKQGAMMSEEVRTTRLTDWQKRLLESSQKAQKKQLELGEKERAEMRKIFDKMDPIISAIAQREGLSVVLEKTDSGLVYALPTLDLTSELVRTYNDKFPAKAAPPKDGPKSK
jgi:outer membrane protein